MIPIRIGGDAMSDPELEQIKRRKLEALMRKGLNAETPVFKLDSSNFDHFISENKMVLVDFWAEWCGPCRMMSPIVDELSRKHTKVRFAKLNVDENPAVAQRFGILSIPTFVFFREGKPAASVVGAVGKEVMERFIEKNSA